MKSLQLYLSKSYFPRACRLLRSTSSPICNGQYKNDLNQYIYCDCKKDLAGMISSTYISSQSNDITNDTLVIQGKVYLSLLAILQSAYMHRFIRMLSVSFQSVVKQLFDVIQMSFSCHSYSDYLRKQHFLIRQNLQTLMLSRLKCVNHTKRVIKYQFSFQSVVNQ